MKQDSSIPGLLALIALSMAILGWLLLSGCASTTFYLDGKRLARMEGDMTEVVFTFEKDRITFTADTVDHSSATIAAGKTSAGNIAAVGAATSTITLLK
jgi:hypothetical protein